MSPMPTRMIDRWQNRIEPSAGRKVLYWHILLGDHEPARELSALCRERLAGFPGFHFTPEHWLHITTYVPGPLDEFGQGGVATMLEAAEKLLSDVPPAEVVLGKLIYHPEAIVTLAEPASVLAPVYTAVREATRIAGGSPEDLDDLAWAPHVTLAYSTADQPTAPIVTALGRSLPQREVLIDRVSLVVQDGPERAWNWKVAADVSWSPGPEQG
jgi:2'-5' RNA ligase